jgi:hypothetical protein
MLIALSPQVAELIPLSKMVPVPEETIVKLMAVVLLAEPMPIVDLWIEVLNLCATLPVVCVSIRPLAQIMLTALLEPIV